MQESSWHRRENIWEPSTFSSRHVTTLSVYSALSPHPDSLPPLWHRHQPQATSATAPDIRTKRLLAPSSLWYAPHAWHPFSFFHDNSYQDKHLPALLSSPQPAFQENISTLGGNFCLVRGWSARSQGLLLDSIILQVFSNLNDSTIDYVGGQVPPPVCSPGILHLTQLKALV